MVPGSIVACCQGQVFGASGVIGYVSSARRAPFWPLWYDERCRRETIEETKRGRAILTITFSDATGITPGDEDEYARVLIELWQSADDVENMRRFLEERRVPDAAAQWVVAAVVLIWFLLCYCVTSKRNVSKRERRFGGALPGGLL